MNNKSHKFKSGWFLSDKSCVTNLLVFLETVTDYVDKGLNLDVIYFAFFMAFDTVPYLRLI